MVHRKHYKLLSEEKEKKIVVWLYLKLNAAQVATVLSYEEYLSTLSMLKGYFVSFSFFFFKVGLFEILKSS